MAILASVPKMANAADVRFSLETSDMSENPISSVVVGQRYILNGYVEDIRPNPEGVFAAFMDVGYDSALTSITDPIRFGPAFANGTSIDLSVPGILNEIGAFDGFEPLGPGKYRLFTVPLVADAAGIVNFLSNPADDIPAHETLVFGQDADVETCDVLYGEARLTIVPEPSSVSLLAVGMCIIWAESRLLRQNRWHMCGVGCGA
jgi:hypothetical protein